MRARHLGLVATLAAAAAFGAWIWHERQSQPTEAGPVVEMGGVIPPPEANAGVTMRMNSVSGAALTSGLGQGARQPLILQVVRYQGGADLVDAADTLGIVRSISDIFQPANLAVQISAPPVRPFQDPGRRITEAELATLLLEPQAPGTGWKVTAFMLLKGTTAGELGVLLGKGRDRFAVFTHEHAPGAGAPGRILRTTAHELGHALNLFHNDGDGRPPCSVACADGKTPMNQDACLDPSAWTFDFGTRELDHLRNHPIANVHPGGNAPFGTCVSTHRQRC